MPHFCPHCNAEIADGSVQCPICGQPPTAGSFQDPQAEGDRRFPFWTILPWTLLAAAALLFLFHLIHSGQAQDSASAAAARPLTAPAPSPAASSPAATSSAAVPASVDPAAVPLTVTLSSAGSRHVPVGKPVMVSAYASLPPGQSATLAISYGKDGGPKTLLALAQGSLSSAAWTPTAPGRYRFTASALDSRKNGAFSHHLTIYVDAPPSAPVAAKPASERPAETQRIQRPPLKAAAAPKPRVKTAASPQPYHVAAASFRVKRIADTLAGALRQRGFHAFVRPSARGQYRVETGDFVRRADAQKQVQLLQRDGYPSYLFQTH